MKRKFSRHKLITDKLGFTMIELLISFAIFGMLVAAVAPLFKQGSDHWEVTQSQVELRQNLNSALNFMTRELRQADSVSIQMGAVDPGFDANGDELVAYDVIYNASSEPRGFSWATGSHRTLRFYKNGSIERIVSDKINISNAEVNYDSSDNYFDVSLTGVYIGPNNINDLDDQLTVRTRVFIRSQGEIVEWRETN